MELRHFRYFLAVAEEGSFVRAAARLRVAQPSLSKQIRDLEAQLGVTLLRRLPRGVELTPAGHAFLPEARNTLDNAARAVESAQLASQAQESVLEFANGEEMGVFVSTIADLLAAFRKREPEVGIRVSSYDQAEQLAAVRERWVDVAATFLMKWPSDEFESYRLLDCSMTGVLLSVSHPLAQKPALHLSELKGLTYLHRSGVHWPENLRVFQSAFKDRGLGPSEYSERYVSTPSGTVVQIAAGNAWALGNATLASQVGPSTASIVYRPFYEPPIPAWLALIWLPGASPLVDRLVELAEEIGLLVNDVPEPTEQPLSQQRPA